MVNCEVSQNITHSSPSLSFLKLWYLNDMVHLFPVRGNDKIFRHTSEILPGIIVQPIATILNLYLQRWRK